MADDRAQSRAAEYVDAEHRREHQAYKISHRRAERSSLNYEMSRINSLKQNRAGIDERYLARVGDIQARKERMAEAIRQRHQSIGGRLQALTKKGREQQAKDFWRLDGRARQLELRAAKNHQMHLGRHDGRVMEARLSAARTIKLQRFDNQLLREDYRRHNIENRPNQIHARVRDIERTKTNELRVELKNQFHQQANKPPSQTAQLGPLRAEMKRQFDEQANKPPSQTIQRKR